MADNIDVKDADGSTVVLKTTDVGGAHTPHHHVDSSVLPTGAATAANQSTANSTMAAIQTAAEIIDNFISGARGLVTEDNSAAILTSLQLIDNMIAGGEAQVDVVAALPAGTNAIGKLAANSGVDIGDVDVLSIAAGDNNIGNVDVVTLPALAAGSNTIGNTKDAGPSQTVTRTYTASADMTTAAAISPAPSAGLKIVGMDILVSTDTAMSFSVQEETSATVFAKVFLPANGTVQITLRGYVKAAVADKKLYGKASVAGNVSVTVVSFSE